MFILEQRVKGLCSSSFSRFAGSSRAFSVFFSGLTKHVYYKGHVVISLYGVLIDRAAKHSLVISLESCFGFVDFAQQISSKIVAESNIWKQVITI